MAAALSQTEYDALVALRSFLLSILPQGVEVIRSEINRVAEPDSADFVVMTPILRERLSTNVQSYADVILTGSIAGSTLTVTAINLNDLAVGQSLFGENLTASTSITTLGSGTGGVGTYTVTPAQTVASQQINAGTRANLQPTKITVQLDVHGPHSADNAQIISTLMRDSYACDQFAQSSTAIQPLYASEPRQSPFMNGEDQMEFRWSVDAVLQTNQSVSVPQEFADQVSVGLVSVEATYPPGA